MSRLAVLLALFSCACSASPDVPDAAEILTDAGPRAPAMVGPSERPARLFAPPAHDGVTALPLVLLLHGYGVDASLQDLYFGMTRAARADGFYVLLPDGTYDAEMNRHWDVAGIAIDDHAYLRGIVEETISLVPVVPGEVFIVGHSNGGFMAYRLACDSPDLFAAIVSLAGNEATEPPCAPARPVSVLQIHGTADAVVDYEGGSTHGLTFPSAPAIVERWAGRNGCDASAAETLDARDLISNIDGTETLVTAYRTGCTAASAELWAMQGADHIPPLTPEFTPGVIAWLHAQAR